MKITDQEKFWAGKFGEEYSDRNIGETIISSNLALFSRIFKNTRNINSVLEFGANIGNNLLAIRHLLPNSNMHAVEINNHAIKRLKGNLPKCNVYPGSLFGETKWPICDLVLIKGLLIHLNPEKIQEAYKVLYESSKKYIIIAEYYNPTPVTISYRGHTDRLFKRDFAGELLDLYPDLGLVDYGFVYHRDATFPLDDITWFLLEKQNIGE